MTDAISLLERGGPAIWAIAALSVAATAAALLLFWRLGVAARRGGGSAIGEAVVQWHAGRRDEARRRLAAQGGLEAAVVAEAMDLLAGGLPPAAARSAAVQSARQGLDRALGGLRIVEFTQATAPLLGLLGTVLGMIEAFRALEAAGARADTAVLAGGIWQALLTTAAGMAVAIPAAAVLAWADARVARLTLAVETRLTALFDAGRAGAG